MSRVSPAGKGARTLLVLLATAAMSIASGCGKQQPAAAPAESTTSHAGAQTAPSKSGGKVRIGMIQPLSGNNSAYGQETQAGFEFVVKKINAEGGIKSLGGAQLELVVADSASSPGQAANEARRLITQENVAMLAGTLLSNEMGAVAPIVEQYKTPTLSFWAGGSRSSYLFSMGYPYDRGYAATMSQFLDWLVKEKKQNIKNVVLVSSNYEAGQQVDTALERRLKEIGYNVVGRVPLDQNAQDHTAAVLRIRSLKPDAALGLVTARDGILLHRARYNTNYLDILFIGGTAGYTDPILWQELGPTVATKALTQNVFGMTGFSPKVDIKPMKQLLSETQNANLGVPIGQNFVHGAQAARMVQAILEQAGSTDREAIYKAFLEAKIPPGSPNLYLPRSQGLQFGDDRMLKDVTTLIVQWETDGSQQVVYPPQFAHTEPRLPKP